MALGIGDATGHNTAAHKREVDLRDRLTFSHIHTFLVCAATWHQIRLGERHDGETPSGQPAEFVVSLFIGRGFRDGLIVKERVAGGCHYSYTRRCFAADGDSTRDRCRRIFRWCLREAKHRTQREHAENKKKAFDVSHSVDPSDSKVRRNSRFDDEMIVITSGVLRIQYHLVREVQMFT